MKSFNRPSVQIIILILFGLFGVATFCGAETEHRLKTYEFTSPGTVGFSAYAFLHDFKGETSNFKGRFELDLAHLDKPGRGAIEIEARTLNTRNRQRDKIMRENHLQTAKFPLIRFVVRKATLDSNDADEKKADYLVDGELQLHGVVQPIRLVITLDYKDPNSLKVVGRVPLLMSDFDIPIPSLAKIIRVKNKVDVFFQLTGKPI